MDLKKLPKLSDRLIYIRKLNNLSQAELAKIAGTTQQAIQQAEKGKARHPRYLHNLAMELNVPIEWLLFGETENKEVSKVIKEGLSDRSADVLDQFFAMPEEDQELIYKLMQSRKDKAQNKEKK